MDAIPTSAFIAVGAIAAALIAGFFSFLNLITSKEQKISEFRQQWINELRQEIADFTAAVTYLSIAYDAYRAKHPEDKDRLEFYDSVRESYERVVGTFTSISLRINPNEKNKKLAAINSEFLEALHKTRKLFNDVDLKESRLQCNVIREKSIPLLKEEWRRVKQGERTYRISKVVAALILLSGLVAGGVALYRSSIQIHSAPSEKPQSTTVAPTTPPANPAVQGTLRGKAAQRP